MVAYWAEEGATWFKAYTRISRAELGAAIEEAHRHGLRFTAHLCSVTFREAVDLGIDSLEHGFFTNTEYHPDKEPDECPPDFRSTLRDVDVGSDEVNATIDHMVDNEVALTSTLAVYELSVPGRPPLEDRNLEALSPGARNEYLARREEIASAQDAVFTELFPKAQAFEYQFFKAGGLLAAGVDPTGNGGALPGFGDQRNYELLLEAEFTASEALQVMSLNGARVLGVDDELGSIEAGKLADLILIDGDPVSDPFQIRNVVDRLQGRRRLRLPEAHQISQGTRRPGIREHRCSHRHRGPICRCAAYAQTPEVDDGLGSFPMTTGKQALPRPEWLRLTSEAALEPDRPICDSHHHLWDRPDDPYFAEDFAADLQSGHNIVSTVFIECGSRYLCRRARGDAVGRRDRVRGA